MDNKKIKRIVGVFTTIFLVLIFWANPFYRLELIVQDITFQSPGLQNPDIFVIGIDEETLAEFGPFHVWSRSLIGEAINILNGGYGRPAVIGIDILYAQAMPLQHTVYSQYNGDLYDINDQILIDAVLNANNVVLASSVHMGHYGTSLIPQPINIVKPFFYDLLKPQNMGVINVINDVDSVIRNSMLQLVLNETTYTSFPLSVANMYKSYHGLPFSYFAQTHSEAFVPFVGLPGLQGTKGDFFEMSFSEIFSPYFVPDWYEGAVILIGAYAIGMGDQHLVPIGNGIMHGVEILANMVNMIIDGTYKLRVSEVTSLLMVILIIISFMAIGELLDLRILFAITVVSCILYWIIALQLFENGYVLPILTPIIAILFVFLYQMVYNYIIGVIDKSRLRAVFKKYVDASLVDNLIKQGGAEANEVGKKKHIAVMFVDIRGFTPLAESLKDSPEQIVKILNEYLQLTSHSIFNNGGSIDKFIGDATMALFNGFVPQEDYVYKAVKASWDMVHAANDLNQTLKKQFNIEIGFGIGIHCGDAIVGNLGPSFRKDYTAIGDVVNTAARLESKASQGQVFISEDVYDKLKDRIVAVSMGDTSLKGKSTKMQVYLLTNVL